MLNFLRSKGMLGLWVTAVLAMGLALGAERAEAATVTISVSSFGAGGGADVAGALAAQDTFHGAGRRITEDFEDFGTGPSGAAMNTAVGIFSPFGPFYYTGTAGLGPHEEAHIRDGSGVHGGRYNTTSVGANYLDSNDNGGIRLEIPGASGVGSFNKLSLLATDIDDVAGAGFSIEVLGGNVDLVRLLAGSLGKFPNGTLHLITFLFSDPVSDVGINFMSDLNDGFGLDSVVVSTVPLPPAALLFLTGLAGMGFLARRRRAKLNRAAA